jgi:reactive intermediate/imine deaminase
MSRTIIQTDKAPAAIGPYSQAVRVGQTVYLSGQIPLLPDLGVLLESGIESQIHQVFRNLTAVCTAAGGSLADIVRLGIFLVDLDDFAAVNAVMAEYMQLPYPARSTVQVSALPRGARIEIDAVMVLG